ncbi:MAG: hypothetical protein V3V10_02540, partial [Planctomycetota bacterium]
QSIAVPALKGVKLRFILDGFETDQDKSEMAQAIHSLITLDKSYQAVVQEELFEFYEKSKGFAEDAGVKVVKIRRQSIVMEVC